MSDQAAPAKVHTEHDGANKAIESMREVAATIKTLGDELVEMEELREDNGNLQGEVNELTERLAEAEYQAEQGAEALAAVDDYRLGLCDRDELLQRVCGRT